MRIISLALAVFLHVLYKVVVDVPYSVRREVLPAYPCVSVLVIENTGANGRYVSMARRSTPRSGPAQPPDYRTYSAEVTGQRPQSPASSQCSPGHGGILRPARALIIYRIYGGLSRVFLLFKKFFLFVCRGGFDPTPPEFSGPPAPSPGLLFPFQRTQPNAT